MGGYFGMLFIVSLITGRKADENAFFRANKSVPWYVVAYGMIGASISGVTFISVPGWVGTQQFGYMMMVVGYLIGYVVIAFVLMPLYYRLNLTSIYKYLEQRFGFWSYKTGAAFFLLSRLLGSSFRLFLVVLVMDEFVLGPMGLPFELTVIFAIALIWVFTFRGGMKTVIWTDVLQTTFLLAAAGLSVWWIAEELNIQGPGQIWDAVAGSKYSKIVFTDIDSQYNWVKQLLGGAFISMTMTGLDQDMMQKNLTCKTLKDAQKNMMSLSVLLVVVNLVFLSLGALLYMYGTSKGLVHEQFGVAGKPPLEFLNSATGLFEGGATDRLFPYLALQHLPTAIGVMFILGLFAAAYASADSALTALTTSFCIDYLNFEGRTDQKRKNLTRQLVHVGMSVVTFLVILIFHLVNDKAVIGAIFTAATYTYGPLLGLYAFGLFTRLKVRDGIVPFICILAPVLCYLFNTYSEEWFGLTKNWLGFATLPVNGLVTFLGLLAISNGRMEKEMLKS
jgi:Na+/proline symporter